MILSPDDEVVEAVQGGKIDFELAIVDENLRPVDTSVYDQFKVCIKLDSSTALVVSQVATGNGSIMTKVGAATLGVFRVVINPLDSATLKKGERQDIDFEMSENAAPTNIIRQVFKDRLSVEDTSC